MVDKVSVEGKPLKQRLPLEEDSLPRLMYTHGTSKHKQVQTFYSVWPSHGGPKACIRSIPQLRGKNILWSYHDWLILCDRKDPSLLSIFNPQTSQTVGLRPLCAGLDVRESMGVITSPPYCDACLFLLCFSFNENGGMLVYCRPAQPNCGWLTQTRAIQLQGVAVRISDMTPVDGVIYGTTNTGVHFYIKDDLKSLSLVHLEVNRPPRAAFYCDGSVNYWLESCGRLYDVHMYFVFEKTPQLTERFVAVKVWELDLQKNAWVEANSLDGRAFFFSSGSSTWCYGSTTTTTTSALEPIGGIKGNCIYIHLPEDLPRPLYVYDLVDHTWTTLSSCPGLIRPCGCDNPFWVIPQQLRLLASMEQKESMNMVDSLNQEVCDDSPVECQELSQQKEFNDTPLGKLPVHITEMIVKHMNLFDYWNFRASCKSLRSSFPNVDQKTNNNCPLFVFEFGGLCKIMDPYRNDSRSNRGRILPLLPNLSTLFFKNGWLLYSDGTKCVKFFNILTEVEGDFPALPSIYEGPGDHRRCIDYKSIAFSSDSPSSSDCLIVAVYVLRTRGLCFLYLRHGDTAWSTCMFDHNGHTFRPSSNTPVCLHGTFYYLDTHGHLGELGFVDGNPSWQVYDKPQIPEQTLCSRYLVECNGELYSVIIIGVMGNWVEVFRFDFTDKCWVKIDYLENHTLFISHTLSSSMVTNGDEMRNKIFLPWLKDNGVVYYSQDTKKYHIMGRDEVVLQSKAGVVEPSWCCWF